MKYCLLLIPGLLFFASCNRNNEEMPVCQLSGNPNYFYQSGYNLQFPNAFTPNGDGRNDRYRPLSTNAQFSAFQLTVMDKDGNSLFTTADTATPGWDGRNSAGTLVSPGRYRVNVSYRTTYGEAVTQTFCVALLSYGGAHCIPQSADGTYYFEDMYDPNYGSFHNTTSESICL